METQLTEKDVEKLIAAGREEEAIEAMLTVADFQARDVRSLIFITSNKYKKLRHSLLLGKISQEDAAVRSAEINSNLLEIIERINWERPDPETIRRTEEKKKNRKRQAAIFTGVSLLLLLLIVVLSARYDLFRTQPPDNPPPETTEDLLPHWEGQWQHELESTVDRPVTGNLRFRIDGQDHITAEASNLAPNGSRYTSQLFDITATENGRTLTGQWKSPDIRTFKGTFQFRLESKDVFSGYYTREGQSGKFYWRGRR